MAAPNLLNISSIVTHSYTATLTSSTTPTLQNAAGSNTVQKIENLLLINTNVFTQLANVSIVRGSTLPGTYPIASNISIPPYSTMALLGKDTSVYLEEYDTLQANCSSGITMIVAYQVIST